MQGLLNEMEARIHNLQDALDAKQQELDESVPQRHSSGVQSYAYSQHQHAPPEPAATRRYTDKVRIIPPTGFM